MMRKLAFTIALLFSAPALAGQPAAAWPSPLPGILNPAPLEPPPVVPAAAETTLPNEGIVPPPEIDAGPDRILRIMELPQRSLNGQQHWLAVNFALGLPTVGRVGVKVLSRDNNSLWLEAYGGAALFNSMYGFGARVQHTALTLGNGDNFYISPGIGTQILPDWYDSDGMMHGDRHHHGYGTCGHYSTLYFLAGDVDFSWLHDFSPRFGFELGMKLGLSGRLSGAVGDDYPGGIMWGRSVYPIAALYSGFRF